MITNENLIEIIVGVCKPQIDNNQVDPKQAIACLIGAIGTIALDYGIDTDATDIEIDKVLSELEIKFKDHPNFRLIMGEVSYETALANQKKAAASYSKASDKLQEANKALEAAKRELEIECNTCQHKTKVSDIEVIDEIFNGWPDSSYDPEWHYTHRTCWVCPKCQTPHSVPDDKGPFVRGFKNYVKAVHEWESDKQSCHGRVLELLGPHFKREAERKNKEDHERKVREARKLLAEEDSANS